MIKSFYKVAFVLSLCALLVSTGIVHVSTAEASQPPLRSSSESNDETIQRLTQQLMALIAQLTQILANLQTQTLLPTSAPTATLLVNGASSASINEGESVVFSWVSSNANSFLNDEEVVYSCPTGSVSFGLNNRPFNPGSVGIMAGSGSTNVRYTVSAGCIITTTFTAKNTTTGQEARSNATVFVRPVSTTQTPTITLLSPNGGAYWLPGSTQTVTWSTSNIAFGEYEVLVRLRSVSTGREYNLGSGSNIAGQPTSFTFRVPTTIPVDAYYVEVKTSVNNVSYSDSSDQYIKIVYDIKKFIQIIAPNGYERFSLSEKYEISWQEQGIGNVSVALYKNDQWFKWIWKDIEGWPVDSAKMATSWRPADVGVTAADADLGEVFKIYITGQKTDGTGYVDDRSDVPFKFFW